MGRVALTTRRMPYPPILTPFPQELQCETSKLRAENRSLKSTRPVTDGQARGTASSVSLAKPKEDDVTRRGCQEHGIFRTFFFIIFHDFLCHFIFPHSFLSVSLFKEKIKTRAIDLMT